MEKTLQKTVLKISKEAAFILLAVASAVILPQVFHGVGILFGIGGTLGQIFLPMYIPVLIFGFYRGPIPGAIAGLLSPLVSFAITAMPLENVLPYITVELIATGLLAGAFSNVKWHPFFRVLCVQVIAKAIRLALLACTLYFANAEITSAVLFAGILTSVPGVVIQLALVSYLIFKKEKERNAQ